MDYNGSVNTVHETILKIIRDNEDQNLVSLLHILDNDYILLSVIKEHVESNNLDYNISNQQTEFIKEKCKKISTNFNAEKVLKFSGHDNFKYSLYFNYYVLKTLYFFDKKFEVKYNTDFYLKTLRYCNIANFADNDIGIIDFIKKRIDDELYFTDQIIKNINHERLDYFSLKVHINYVIENELKMAYSKVEEFILDEGHSTKDFLERYIKLAPNKIFFLKQCCNDINTYLCWEAINILKDNNSEYLYLEQVSEQYLDSGETDHLASALNILFYLNNNNSLEKYYSFLNRKNTENDLSKPDGFLIKDIQNYTCLNEIEFIEKLFYIIYNPKNNETFDYYHAKDFFNNLVIHLSKTEDGFNKIKSVFLNMVNSISDDSQLFYCNHLLENTEKSYLENLSQPSTFIKAKEIIENIENPIQQKIEIVENHFNFKENSTFKGNQFGGENNTQTNNFNSYSTNSDVLKAEEILKEFQQLKIENDDWKNIFIDGMKDLIDLKEADTEVQAQKPKTQLRRVHDAIVDFGKKTNDWKNLAVLPVEFHDKIPKLIELENHLSKFLGF